MSVLKEATEFKKVLNKTIAPSKIRECLLDNEYLSDVIFQLADGEELRAHKMFLITSGPIFHKLFSDHTEDVIQLNLEWINKQTMLEVCRFIYSDILNLNDTNMMEIWSAAIKLEMKYLKEKTIEFIFESLNEKTVFNVLQTNLKHNDFRLYLKCFDYITKNPKKCLETEEFLDLPVDLLKTVLQTCKLPNKSSKDAVRAWGYHNEHEDFEELLLILSLNEGSDAPDEKSNDSDSDESSVSHASPPDASSNGTNEKENLSENDTLNKDKKPEGGVAPFDNLFQKPKQLKKKEIDFYGTPIHSQCYSTYLPIGIMSKDVIIQEICFIHYLAATDMEFEIWISDTSEYGLNHIFNDIVSTEKLRGRYNNRYILPNQNIILKAKRNYSINIKFREVFIRRFLKTYTLNSFSSGDRIQLNLDDLRVTNDQIISGFCFVDA